MKRHIILCAFENTSHTELYGVGSMHWTNA